MHILICADAYPQVGTGHLRRMLTLADALIEQNAQITVQSSALGIKIAQDSNVPVRLIDAPCIPQAVIETLKHDRYDAVLLDNYQWDVTSEALLRAHVPFIAVVDDLADRLHDADLLLDQNAHHQSADYDDLLPANCQRLVGGDYCLLGAQFRTLPETTKGPNAPVFVSLGGGDPNNDLVPMVQTLLTAIPYRLTIATGSHIDQARELQQIAEDHPLRIELVFDSSRVAQQMQESQFAVAAGGTMTWERAALGLPSLCLIVADNQIDSASWLADRDIHTPFDLRPGWSRDAFSQAVANFATDMAQQKRHAQKSRDLIPLDGAVRTARALLNSLNTSAFDIKEMPLG